MPEEYKPISNEVETKFKKGLVNQVKSSSKDEKYRTPETWEQKGLTYFKRKCLGLCGLRTLKSLDELASILIDTGVVCSVDSGKQLIQKELYGRRIDVGSGFLNFTKVQNRKSQEVCKITFDGFIKYTGY